MFLHFVLSLRYICGRAVVLMISSSFVGIFGFCFKFYAKSSYKEAVLGGKAQGCDSNSAVVSSILICVKIIIYSYFHDFPAICRKQGEADIYLYLQ